MSITFWAPDAPRTKQQTECPICEGAGVDAYVEGLDCGYCNGRGWLDEEKSSLPEINMSNTNAWDFMARMGVTPDHCGRIPHASLSEIGPKLALIAYGLTSVFLEREPSVVGSITYCGRDHEYVVRRATEMLELVKQAQAGGYDITWG